MVQPSLIRLLAIIKSSNHTFSDRYSQMLPYAYLKNLVYLYILNASTSKSSNVSTGLLEYTIILPVVYIILANNFCFNYIGTIF